MDEKAGELTREQMLAYELDAVLIDTKEMGKFDEVCRATVTRVRDALRSLPVGMSEGRHWVYAAAEAHRPLLAQAVGTDTPWGFNHLSYMLTEIAGMKSATKACRWLGWVQACLCFTGCATLDQLKAINKTASDLAQRNRGGAGEVVNWIPVSKLKDHREPVVYAKPHSAEPDRWYVGIAYWSVSDKWVPARESTAHPQGFTHWIPLPAAPAAGDGRPMTDDEAAETDPYNCGSRP